MLVLSRDLGREPQRVIGNANNLYNHLNFYMGSHGVGFSTHDLSAVRVAGSHLFRQYSSPVEACLTGQPSLSYGVTCIQGAQRIV